MGSFSRRAARQVPAVAALLVIAVACGGGNNPSPTTPNVDPSVLPSMDVMLAEKSLGSASAPHTVIEYSSFTCPHCAEFDVVYLPQLKANYIDTGSVRFIFRNSPRDTTVDLAAAMLARCSGDRYFDAVHALFSNQGAWASSPSQALDALMRNFGMSQQVIDACKASTTLRDGVLKMKADGLQQYNYEGVPAFIVDGTHHIEGISPQLWLELQQYLQ